MSDRIGRDGGAPTIGAGSPTGEMSLIAETLGHQLEIHTMSHDHDTVVVDKGGGSGMGAILAVIGIVVLLAAVWYFALGPGAAPSTTNNTNNNTVNPPAVSAPPAS